MHNVTKTNDPILRNLVTGGQTDESDFIGRCPANFERPDVFLKRPAIKELFGIYIFEILILVWKQLNKKYTVFFSKG